MADLPGRMHSFGGVFDLALGGDGGQIPISGMTVNTMNGAGMTI